MTDSTLHAVDVKARAAGQWPDILASIGGIDRRLLDGKHHPCPRCGGTDRFRMIDEQAGAVLCNQCFNERNGDGFAALQWLTGKPFRDVLRSVADYTGVTTSNGNGHVRQNGNGSRRGKIVTTYDYRDESGELLFQVCRMEPKDFRQRRPDGNSGWTWKTKGVRRVLYRLPELLVADPSEIVFIVEGEKDVDRLRSMGLVATCNAGGAGKWRREYADCLQDRHVAIIADNDAPGMKHAETVARSLHETAASVKLVELSDVGQRKGFDVSDWLG